MCSLDEYLAKYPNAKIYTPAEYLGLIHSVLGHLAASGHVKTSGLGGEMIISYDEDEYLRLVPLIGKQRGASDSLISLMMQYRVGTVCFNLLEKYPDHETHIAGHLVSVPMEDYRSSKRK